MTSNEQIRGILEIIDYAKSVSADSVPVSIERFKFEEYPDYESILEKLDWDFNAINIKAYPKMEDVDYHSYVGFMKDSVLKEAISYRIELLTDFDECLKKYSTDNNLDNHNEARIGMAENKVTLTYQDGKIYEIKSLRTDSATYNFMYYLIAHSGRPITRTTIQTTVDGCKTRSNMTELVRDCGFNKQLKSYFFKGTTKDKIVFSINAKVPREIVEKSTL